MKSVHLAVTALGALSGIIIGIVKKPYRRIGYGITAGSLLVGLPVSFMSQEAETESVSKLSDLQTEINAALKKVGIETDSNGIIDTE